MPPMGVKGAEKQLCSLFVSALAETHTKHTHTHTLGLIFYTSGKGAERKPSFALGHPSSAGITGRGSRGRKPTVWISPGF